MAEPSGKGLLTMRRVIRHVHTHSVALPDELHISFGRRSARDLAEWTSASRGPLAEPWRLTFRAPYDHPSALASKDTMVQ